jgi:hypothetical protein
MGTKAGFLGQMKNDQKGAGNIRQNHLCDEAVRNFLVENSRPPLLSTG